jgi:Arc/MetJ-type ribon-helix-helix transcriptional regulator
MSELKKDTTEKITININTVDLGYIDLLVTEGYYASRTEFIKTSIKKQLDKHEEDTKKLVKQKENHGFQLSIGIGGFSKKELERLKSENTKKMNIIFIGLFVLPKEIPLDLLEQTVESMKVYGVCRCSQEIKERYGL